MSLIKRLMRLKSNHQQNVEEFMLKAGQSVPSVPLWPSAKTRELRAKLILEEALETIEGLGVTIELSPLSYEPPQTLDDCKISFAAHPVVSVDQKNKLVEVVDGCCDIIVVTTGTLSAFGVADILPQLLVDESNLQKFGPGGYKREDGKWIKPPDWQPPDLLHALELQGMTDMSFVDETEEND